MTIGVRREAGELDIHKPSIGTVRQYARALYNPLFAVDLKGKVSGELVESWEVPDPTTYLLKLRKDVKFHDGTDLNAEAVKFSIDRQKDPAEAAFYRGELVNVQRAEVVDPLTVRLVLENPDSTLPARLSDRAGWVVSPAAVKKCGKDYALHPVGTGPFEFVEWVKDDHLSLKRFDGYWEKDDSGGKLPYLDTLQFKPFPDLTVMFTSIRTGNLDIIEIVLPSDVDKVKADPNLRLDTGTGQNWTVAFNTRVPPFNDVHLRRAVAWALDREAIHKAIFFSLGSPKAYLVSPDNWAFDPNGPLYSLDAAKSKAELAAANKANGFKFTLHVNNITIDTQLGQVIKAQLAPVGIDVDVVTLEGPVAASRRISGDYEASMSQQPPAADPDQDVGLSARSTGTSNSMGYNNPKVDELLDKARAAIKQEERAPLYHQVQQILFEDAPAAYIHRDADLKVLRADVQGYPTPFDGYIRVPRLWRKQ